MTSKIVVNNIESDSGISSVTFTSDIELGTKNLKGHNLESTGIITATTFSGSGANLTSLPAAQLTGTVADARISTLTASKLSGALPAISGANLTGLIAGITMADAWVLSSSYDKSGGAADITANWVRHSNGASYIGHIGSSLMAESSGIFTFPTTGIYMVTSTLAARTDGGYASYAGMRQYYSGNSGSSYNVVASGYDHGDRASAHFVSNQTVLYDITDVSIARVKFDIENSHAIKVFGNSVNRNTGATFIRLGDT